MGDSVMHLSDRSRAIPAFPHLLVLLVVLALPGSMGVAAYATNGTFEFFMKSGMASSTTGALSCGSWSVVPSLNVKTHPTYLYGVTATSAKDVWAVGGYNNSSHANQTLIEHWDGTSWSIVPSPKTGSYLLAVKAISGKNVWAVGASSSGTLIERWDGTSWNIVPSPNPLPQNGVLYGVAAVSASDIWAVGFYTNSSNVDQTLIEHWNGSSWSIVPSPNTGSSDSLNAVSSSSTSDVWAVGAYANSSNVAQTLIEHWNGSSWSIVASPNVGTLGSSLAGVTSISASNAWAVGSYTMGVTPYSYQQTLIEHWNGSTWSIVSSPNAGSYWNDLKAVKSVSASNIWAVGDGLGKTLIEHWNGTRWRVVSSPNAGTHDPNDLFAVTQIPGTSQMWAVGSYHSHLYRVGQTLTEFYC
jgi:hypothetical protein